MMNHDNDKTVVRSRKVSHPASGSVPDHGINVLPVGTRLGEFEILDLVGEGGFGIVYLAYDHSLERHVALKEYMPTGLATRTTRMAVTVRSQHNADTFTAGLKSFVNEARMLAQFDSPALVKVYRFWEANGTAYMVMPFYDGITLKKALKEHRIAPTENWIRMLLADLFDAIETIHRVQCFHRDIAPDNILLLKDGRPLLLDFGAARRVIGDLTQGPTVILKPGFAPIEQYADIAGLRQGAWTDIYALAAVVYYLITGRAPPPAVARIVHDEMVPAREVGKGRYSKAFLAVVDKGLAVKPEQRYQSIAELRRALDIQESVPRNIPLSENTNTNAPTVPIMEAKPDRKSDRHADARPVAQPDSNWQRNRGMNQAAIDDRPGRAKPQWLMLGLLLSAGIAAGVYWGTQHWDGTSEQAASTSGNSTAMESSGSSEVPEEPATREPATAEPSPPASSTASPPAVATAPSNPSPASPPATPSAAPSATPSTTPPTPAPRAAAVAPSQPPSQQSAPPPVAALSKPPAPAIESTPATRAPNRQHDTQKAPADDTQPSARERRQSSEEDLWRVATASDRNDAYQFYLNRYPKGHYAAIARQKLKRQPRSEETQSKLAMNAPRTEPAPNVTPEITPDTPPGTTSRPATEPTPKAAPEPQPQATRESAPARAAPSLPKEEPPSSPAQLSADDELWKAATSGDKIGDYQSYLNQFPNGRHALAANDKLASLKRQLEPSASPSRQAPAESSSGSSKAAEEQAATKPELASPSGNTVLRMANQTMTGRFTADPKTGVVSGTGRIVWNNGDRFDGTLVNGVKQGKGQFTWSNGQRYKGDWANDMPNGKGTIYFANGNRYDGEVKDGQPHGHGVTHFKGGDVYAGNWVRGKSNGHGRYTWANGSYWDGEFRDDQRTENGKMVFADRSSNTASSNPAAAQTSGGAQNAGSSAAGKAGEEQ